jgi:Methyltransferase domain
VSWPAATRPASARPASPGARVTGPRRGYSGDPALASHPDRLRWNARYEGRAAPLRPHDLAAAALRLVLPDGPVLELASGASGSALAAAAAGRHVTAVDISDVALRQLRAEAGRLGLGGKIEIVHADLTRWRPAGMPYALVLCAGYWDRAVFGWAAAAVAAGGVLGWQALTQAARAARPALPADWCLQPGEPATRLPPGFTVLAQDDRPGPGGPGAWRRLLARRGAALT